MKRIIISIATVVISSVAIAQTTGEAYRFSSHDFAMGTARSAAMAGAYTSLGADPISISINPAGLAMYRSSEVSVTPSLLINNNQTNYNGQNNWGYSKGKALVSNFAGIYASDNGFVLGLSYNRLADFAGRQKYLGTLQAGSIGEMYAKQLKGIYYQDIETPQSGNDTYRPFFNHIPLLWNPIMAYQTILVNPITSNANGSDGNTYGMGGIFEPALGDRQTPLADIITGGSVNEIALSGAYNYNDFIYFGLTFGFQDIAYQEDYQYTELTDAQTYQGPRSLDNFTQRQWLRMSGFGFNMKLGVTVRPTPWLRIGVAYHTPTWIAMNESSYSDMTVYDKNYAADDPNISDTPDLVNDYNMRTPSRLLAGISFTIAKRIIISADYERAWYGHMKYNSDIYDYGYRASQGTNAIDNLPNISDNYLNNGQIDLNNIISNYYTATNTFRVGIEAQPANGFFLRAGYAYSSSPYKDVMSVIYNADNSNFGASNMYTAGLGYRGRIFGVDITYTNKQTNLLPYKYYGFITNDSPSEVIASEGFGYAKNTRQQILLTLSFKIN